MGCRIEDVDESTELFYIAGRYRANKKLSLSNVTTVYHLLALFMGCGVVPRMTSCVAVPTKINFLDRPTRRLFHLFLSFQKYITILTTNKCEKNVHQVYSAGIQTHDLWNMSLLP